jgi:hypothetical protein
VPQTPNILALDVLVTGPEFRSDESRMAFVRISEAVEQFSAHSRETIVLVRQPTDLDRDHFAILWSHGLALVSFYNQTGIIHGKASGPWRTEPAEGSFANPFEQMRSAAKNISTAAGRELPISLVAIFTGPVRDLEVETAGAEMPSHAMTLDFAVARSLVHMPNILRVIDRKSAIVPFSEIEKLATELDRSGTATEVLAQNAPPRLLEQTSQVFTTVRRSSKLWIIPVAVIVLGVIIYSIVISSGTSKVDLHDSVPSPSTQPSKSNGPSQIVIELPKEVQLFISPRLYGSRLELDQALAHAEGQRYLPATEQVIVYDSLTLAKGVYGYFKVDNAWRKGKLLQTFQRSDTIHVDNFLGPLP